MLGSVVYHVLLEDGRQVKRHTEQLRNRQGTMKIAVSQQKQSPEVVETELLDDGSSTNAQEAAREHETIPPTDTMMEPEQVPEENTTTVPRETGCEPSSTDVRRSIAPLTDLDIEYDFGCIMYLWIVKIRKGGM